jgi:Tol biopolymer transport system component
MSSPSGDEPSKPQTPYKYVPRLTDDEVYGTSNRWRTVGVIGAAVVLLAAIAGYLLTHRSKTQAYAAPAVAQPLVAAQWTFDTGLSIMPAISHDGKLVAYPSDREGPGNFAIWLRPYRSGAVRRLTKEEFHAADPDFSPDDSQLVYRSERDGGGIYMLPVSGEGEPRLLAKGGIRPRFSPNGKWVAYYTVSSEGNATPFPAGRLYVIPPAGGVPKQVRPEFLTARYPVWAPDSDLLLFEGANSQGALDWWVTPIDGGDATRTHAFEKMDSLAVHAAPERWDRNNVLFAATREANLHLWELAIDPHGWQASGTPRQLTNSDGVDQAAAVSQDGRIMFGSMRVTMDIWSLPLDGAKRQPSGPLQRVTDDHALNQTPAVGVNTEKMIYVSNKRGSRDIWVHDLKAGADWALTSFHRVSHRPVLSWDENRVAYGTFIDKHCAIVVQDLGRGSSRNITSGCFNIWDWSPDGSSLLVYDPGEAMISAQLLKIESGQRQTLLSRPNVSVFDAGFSRDGKWIAFSAGDSIAEAEVFIAPFHGTAIKAADWIPVTHGGGSMAAWAPDAGALYYQSSRDGFHCIWAQQLNSAGRPIGEPYAIQHLHSASLGLHIIRPNDFHMSATKDRLVFNMTQATANLWLTAKP